MKALLVTVAAAMPTLLTSLEIAGTVEIQNGVRIWTPESQPFEGREHAGRLLGEELLQTYGLAELKEAVILACPRGGMLFAKGAIDVIREAGGNPSFDLVITRKILAPGTKDYGIGSINEQGEIYFIDQLLDELNIDLSSEQMQKSIESVQQEVTRRVNSYRQNKPLASLADKVVVVMDGVVGGGTMIGCVKSAQERAQGLEKRLIVASPVVSPRGKRTVVHHTGIPEEDFCSVVIIGAPGGCLWNSDDLYQKFTDFASVSDEQVREILATYAKN